MGPASSEGLSAGCVLVPLLNLETCIRVFLSIQPECYVEKKKKRETLRRTDLFLSFRLLINSRLLIRAAVGMMMSPTHTHLKVCCHIVLLKRVS